MSSTPVTLIQRKPLFRVHQFRLATDAVEFEERTLHGTFKCRVPFEELPKDPEELKRSSLWSLGYLVAFTTLLVGSIVEHLTGKTSPEYSGVWILGTLALVSGTAFINSTIKLLIFRGRNSALAFLNHRSHQAELRPFLQAMERKRVDYLRDKHLTHPFPIAPEHAIHKLAWLKEIHAISEEEFELLKLDVLEKTRRSEPGQWSLN